MAALTFSFDTLKTGGHFLCKYYQGTEEKAFETKLKRLFAKVHREKPDSSRTVGRLPFDMWAVLIRPRSPRRHILWRCGAKRPPQEKRCSASDRPCRELPSRKDRNVSRTFGARIGRQPTRFAGKDI
jgi:hypothetical protein